VYAEIVQLKMQAPNGKMRVTDAADTKTLLRIIQSVRSTLAEPFKRWLAEVGTQRLEEIEDPPKLNSPLHTRSYPDQSRTHTRAGKHRCIAVHTLLLNDWQVIYQVSHQW